MRPEQDEFLERLFRTHFSELEVYAYALLKNRSDAEAAVQEAFHTACIKADDIMDSSNPIGWMKKTVKNISQNMRKIPRNLNFLSSAGISLQMRNTIY